MVIRLETKTKKIPLFVISAKYEVYVKWILRFLTFVGIIVSICTFKWFVSISISILLVIIERVLETVVFQVISIYVQPIPEWDNNQWLSMVYYKIQDAKHVGILIQTEDQAKKLHECIKQWNYGKFVDREDNIKLTFVIENDGSYVVFLYPSHERRSIKAFSEQVEYEMFKKSESKNLQQIVVSITFCKPFPYQTGHFLQQFVREYQQNTPYALGVYYLTQSIPELSEGKPFVIKSSNGKVKSVGERPFIKFHVKIKDAGELTNKDYEYHYRRLVMER
jgi:hypothetical protein